MTDPTFTLVGTNPFGLSGTGGSATPAFADIDGDGDLDAFIGAYNGFTNVYRNVGTTASPSFTLIGSTAFGLGSVGGFASPTLVDIDGDGDLDALIGNQSGSTVVYRNVGTTTQPSFTLAGTNPFGLGNVGTNAAPTFADLDGDGDLDALIGGNTGNSFFYRNIGTRTAPSFMLAGTNPFGLGNVGTNAAPTFADIDGDGDLDALIGNQGGDTVVYRNVGTTAQPSFALVGTNPFDISSLLIHATPTFVDIDGDGDLDELVGNGLGSITLFRNGPTGPDAPTGLGLTAGSNSGSAADAITNIATPTITGSAVAGASVVLYDGATAVGTATANASGLWTITAASLGDGAHALTAKASDVNGTSAASTALTVTIDQAPPTLVSAVLNGTLLTLTYSEALDGSAPTASAFAVTVDGAARTVGTAAVSGKTVTLALDAGASSAYNTVSVDYTPPGSGARTADVAGNPTGALSGQRVKVVGDPNFVLEATNPFGLGSVGAFEAPTFVDIDGDGDLDMFAGNSGGSTVYYRNVGTATAPSFTLAGTNPFGLGTFGGYSKPTFEDIDGDGDLDALIGNNSGNTVFYRNVGTATQPSFTLAGTNPFGLGNAGSFVSPAFADIDGDGDLDALIGNLAGNTVFYRNVGTATAPSFTAGGTNVFGLTQTVTYAAPTFVDIDGDGDLDLLIGGKFNSVLAYRNVGTTAAPSFTLIGTNPFGLTGAPQFVVPSLVDIDGDGDLDALIGVQGGNTVLYRNGAPNTAPVLDAGKAPELASEPASSTDNPIGAVGTLVSDLVGLGGGIANVTDPDGGAVTGIAITATDTSHGILWYTTNGGTSWSSVNGGSTVSAFTSLLLKADANTRLYFQVTDTAFTGTIASAFTFRAWDQTSGTAGSKVNTTTNGGTTAFSAATDTASITISAVGPRVTDARISISGASGTGGAYKIGDTITATWDNSFDGDNNTDPISGVTVDFSQFGGGTAVTASSDANGVWTAKYVVAAGSVDVTNRNVSVSATSGGTTTTADSSNAAVDNVAPRLTVGNMAGIATPTGTGNTLRIGDTVTAVWDNSLSGDNNSDTISGVTADFSQFGGGTAVAMTNSGGVWRQTYVITAGSIDATNRNVAITVTDNAGNTATATDTANRSVDNVAPTVTAGAIGVSGGTGPNGVYRIGDTVTATWDNSVGGDNNADTIGGVTVDFSQFGGGTAVAAANTGGVWTAKYVVTAGGIDAANRNVSVKATDNAGNAATTAGTGNAAVDNVAPTLTDANIAASGGPGGGGAVKAGDTVTVTWNDSVLGDNNSDAISAVSVDFSQFGGGTAVAATNAGGVWTATYTIAAGTALGSNKNVSVTATDDAGNSRTTADTSNLTIANTAPVLDADKAPTLAPGLSTSTGAPSGAVGTLVSDLVGLGNGIGNVSDPDGAAVTGIAVTDTDTSHGAWWYSTDGGVNWTAMGSVSATNALLLKADAGTRLYLQLPNSTYTGTIASAITFRAWDQTSGTAGSKASTASNGGTTAFSAATDTASISITPGAPVGAPTLAAASDSGTSSSDRLTNATAITLTGSGVAANSTVRLYTGTTLVATATADGTGAYQFTDADVSGLTGATSFTVRQVAAGVESADSAPVTVTFDRDRPTLSIAALSGDDRLNGTEAGSALVITGTATAEAGQTVTVGLNGRTYTGTVVTGGGWSVTVGAADLGGLGNQAYTVTADLADAAGNAATQATRTLTVDTVTPEVAITSAALSNRAAPVLAGTAKANSAVTVIIAGATYVTSADGNGGWSVDLATATPTAGTLGLNGNGANAVSATARDAAGNSSAPATQTLVLDTIAPTATVRFEDDSIDALEQRNGSFVITDGEAGVTYGWTITSSGGGQVSGTGQLSAGTTRVGGLDLSGLGDGTLTVTLSLTDPAGNSAAPLNATTRKLTATVDKPAPIAPLATQAVDGATVNGAVTAGTDGGRTTTVSIAAPAAGRQEDASTPNADLADVPVVREQVVDAQTGAVSTVTTLTVSVSTGVAAIAAGSAERHTAADSLAGLIGAIEARTDAGSASRTGLTDGGTGFLAALSGQAQLLVRAIDFSTPNGAPGPSVQTRVTGAGLGGTGQSSTTPTAVVLNTSGVTAPMTIRLDDIQFAAVIGDATLVGGDGEQVVYGDAGRQWLYLGAGDDELHGGAGDDTVASAGGNDTLFGDHGNDVVMGGEGDDWVLGGAGDDLIGGGTGNDRGFGGTGNDLLFGEDGDDTLTGDAGNDTVVGGAGNDLLFGDVGADFLVGEAGNDTLNAGAGNDTALGGDGNDLIGLGDGNDLASGDVGNDTVLGEDGNDTLFGGLGDDLLNGGAGDDLLFADGGADTLWGGAGRDVFALGRSSGGTVVADFRTGEDRLAFTDPGIDLGVVIRSARVEGGNTILDIGNGGRITIVGQTGAVAGWFG